jgi:glucose/arabinose dehydrogenase
MLDTNLTVSTVVAGLDQPTSMAFIGDNDLLILEKATGKVQRVTNGGLPNTVLDLPVNSASERGMLGIALHPDFAENGFVYLFWTESSMGVDTTNIDSTPVLGNRVDRYVWNGSSLAFDRNLIHLRAFQQDPGQSSRGNHNGGVLRFGADGKLYIMFGDNGRRGFLQNVTSGGPVPDDQYGGPEPDDAHLTGVVFRLNDDGSTPADNPFFNVNSGLTGQAAANVKKVFAYGVRNSFGMALDPLSGNIWTQENGDDAFDEINRLRPGFNGGWVQIMGPVNRIAQFKSIESTYGAGNLQQLRWQPTNIADTPQAALARLYMLPGAQYADPEFSWKYAVAPSPLGFMKGRGLGPQFEGDMFVGASRTTLVNGYLFRFRMSADRLHLAFSDSHLSDLVADNLDKFDLTESESLLIGRDFGITTDIETGPNGNLFVVSLSNGTVYEIKSKPSTFFFATLTGGQEVPPTNSTATGTAVLQLSPDEMTARVSLNFAGLSSSQSDAHVHGPAAAGSNAGVLFPLPLGQVSDFQITLTAPQVLDLKSGLLYVNVHSANFPNGEIRGQFQTSTSASAVAFGASKVSVNEAEGTASITVTRSNTSSAATIDYATNDFMAARCDTVSGNASAKCDYTTAGGTLRFAGGESSKTIKVSIIDDAFVEGNETLTIGLSNPTGAGVMLGSPSSASITIVDNDGDPTAANPYLNNAFFVRQQYLDFLLREPDTAGFADWNNVLNGCGPQQGGLGAPAGCDRVHVSSGFFRSPEFGEKGYWVYRFFEGSLGRRPQFAEFMPEMRRLSGLTTDAEQETRRADFIARFMQLPEFTSIYAGITDAGHAAQFIAKLEEKARVTLPETVPPTQPGQPTQYGRSQLIGLMQAGTLTPAQTLRAFIEQKVVWDTYFYRAFVAMQYFGYLRRDPEPAGYDDWVDVLTNGRVSPGVNVAPGDYRHLIFGFVYSVEYRERFGKQ